MTDQHPVALGIHPLVKPGIDLRDEFSLDESQEVGRPIGMEVHATIEGFRTNVMWNSPLPVPANAATSLHGA